MRKYLSLTRAEIESELQQEFDQQYEQESLRPSSPADSFNTDSTLAESKLDPCPTPPPQETEPLGKHALRARTLPTDLFENLAPNEYAQEFQVLLPQITRFSLQELNIDEILSNPQLRHDLYFDSNLQFKPNLEGERGSRKRALGDAYWSTLKEEVESGHMYRIPLLFYEIKAILMDLLPESPELTAQLDTEIDVKLIAQEIEHGVFDASKFVDNLARLLKLNCSPARDSYVDEMVNQAAIGNFAKCIRMCFEILELMKLVSPILTS